MLSSMTRRARTSAAVIVHALPILAALEWAWAARKRRMASSAEGVTRTDRAWSTSDGRQMLVAIVAEMKAYREQLVMQPVDGRCYIIKVVSDLQPFGGRR